CRADTGIKTPADLKGRTLGVWFYGNEYPFLNWMGKLGLKTDGSPGGVKVLKQGFNVDPLIQKQADCISTMTYNEYWQVIDAGYKPSQLVVFKYEDEGVATLEDGLYVMQDKLKDLAFVDKMARFVKASMKGWDDARDQQADARLGRPARQGRLRPHGQDAADRWIRPGHLQGADRRLHHDRDRQGPREVGLGVPFPSSAVALLGKVARSAGLGVTRGLNARAQSQPSSRHSCSPHPIRPFRPPFHFAENRLQLREPRAGHQETASARGSASRGVAFFTAAPRTRSW